MRFWSTGLQVDCTMKTSLPRTESSISTITSPSLKRPTLALPSGMLRRATISSASGRFALPENTIMEVSWSKPFPAKRSLPAWLRPS